MNKFLKLLLVLSYLFQTGYGQLDPFSESEFCHNGEEYNSCGSACERTCSNRREWNKPCTKPCYAGCFCRRGLVRSADGSCVRPNNCNRSSCKKNEEFYTCATGCPVTCKNYQEPIFCTVNCKRGCDCKHGYVRGPRNECILPQNCPITCPRNEVTTNCVNPCNNCFQRGRCYFEYCNRGCDCRANYYRNSTGICVPARQCDSHENICPKNEHYVSCINLCNDCWSRGDCEQTYCQPGCDCIQGYYRDDHGICIAENKCYSHGSGCGVNEEYSYCVVQCNDCETRGNCDYNCEYGCDCKRGFYRDSKGVCVHASQCTGSGVIPKDCHNCDRKCSADEQFYTCIPTCRNTCKNYNDTRAYCDSDCHAGCFCKKGMVRDKYGSCVYPSECPIECPTDEEHRICGSACPATCENQHPSGECVEKCVNGCFCKRGYVRGPDGRCIRPTSCPVVCGENEVYQECGTPCPISCLNRTGGDPYPCPAYCVKGCFCKPGYLRGPDGSCIRPNQCPEECKENELYRECGPACQITCDNLLRAVAPSVYCRTKPCTKGCFCKPGYVRGPNTKCILSQHCQACGRNEIFRSCGPSCQTTCDNLSQGTAIQTQCPEPCTRGCFCKPGFVRGPGGTCIRSSACPVACRENEEHKTCGTACPNTCENKTAEQDCVDICVGGCFCKPGFVKAPDGTCVRQDACPEEISYRIRKSCKENEEYKTCGTACPNTCQNKTAEQECVDICVEGCFCKPGFVKSPDGTCIRQDACPGVCKKNEVHLKCGSPCQDTCETYTKSRGQEIVCPEPCTEGCFCKLGFVRGPHGDCIPPTECHSTSECKENELFNECGSPCQTTCDNATESEGYQQACSEPCIRGCFCKPGYIRDSGGNCILRASCPVVCKEYEIYKDCGTSCQASCSNKEPRDGCSSECVKGCFCTEGYIRGPDRKCIVPYQCPIECGEYSEYKECGTACPLACSNHTSTSACTLQCVKGCFCTEGYVLGPDGKCILPDQCPIECGEYSIYKECGTACPLACSNHTSTNPCTLQCVKGCFCTEGYVLGPDGKCILPDQCPIECGVYSEYKDCGTACPLACSNHTSTSACTLQCVKGCFCTEGYVLGPDGKCILPDQCPIECGEYSEYKECGTACPLACSNHTSTNPCTLQCVKGCFCTEGYVLGPDGKCILPDQCPIKCEENEEYNECGTACQVTCETSGPINCLENCTKGCFCKIGLVRGHDGKCIIAEACPPIACKENEEFHACGLPCEIKCGYSLAEAAAPCQQPCIRGCYCIPGFVRGPGGKCIPSSECPEVIDPGIKGIESMRHSDDTTSNPSVTTLKQVTAIDSRTTSTPSIPTTTNIATSSPSDTTTKLNSEIETTSQPVETSSRVDTSTAFQVDAQTPSASTVSPTDEAVTASPKATTSSETTTATVKSEFTSPSEPTRSPWTTIKAKQSTNSIPEFDPEVAT